VRASSVEVEPDLPRPNRHEATLLVVADGMGGAAGGDVASALAVRSVADHLGSIIPWFDTTSPPSMTRTSGHRDSLPGVRDGLVSAVAQGDSEVRSVASERGPSDMGTTLTIAYVHFPLLYVAHVGDSRCYLARSGRLFQLTQDHTVAEEVGDRMEVEESSQWHHMLTRAIGGGGKSTAVPQVRRASLELGDVVFLCSDGVTKHLADDDLATFLAQSVSATDACQRIVAEANARGGTDNITAVVGRCVPER
jgi:protein phosphatase